MLKIFFKKWAFLSLIIIFDLIIAFRTSLEFFYFFFWFLASFVVLSLVWVAIEYFGTELYLERMVVSKIDEDDILEIETVIKNNSFLPLFNSVLEDYFACATPQERKARILLEYLMMKSSLKLKYQCLCPQRGRYKLGPFSIYLFDPWGLFFLKKSYFIYSELYVYPKIFNIERFPPLARGIVPWFGIETSRISADEHEFYGVREYRPGDPTKRIHWFSTARKDMLIVRQFQHQVFYRATIMFDLEKDKNFGEGKESVAEYVIKIAASVARYLIDRNVSLEVIAHIGELVRIPFNKGIEHLEDILKFLAVAQAESMVSLNEIFENFGTYIPNDSSLIVIMLDKDWEYLPTMLSLQKRNISLIPLILISSSFLYPYTKQVTVKGEQIRFSQVQGLDFVPIFFSQGDNLEEVFLKY